MWRRCFPRTSGLFISIPNYSVLLQRHPTFSNHAAPTRSGINASNDGNQSHKLIFNWILNIIRISFPGNELIPELQTWLEKSVRRNKKQVRRFLCGTHQSSEHQSYLLQLDCYILSRYLTQVFCMCDSPSRPIRFSGSCISNSSFIHPMQYCSAMSYMRKV